MVTRCSPGPLHRCDGWHPLTRLAILLTDRVFQLCCKSFAASALRALCIALLSLLICFRFSRASAGRWPLIFFKSRWVLVACAFQPGSVFPGGRLTLEQPHLRSSENADHKVLGRCAGHNPARQGRFARALVARSTARMRWTKCSRAPFS